VENQKLPGHYIAGFVDGEGCFYLSYRQELKAHRKNKPTYRRWVTYFAIVLRNDDLDILNQIMNTLECGKISFTKDQVRYNIQNIEDIIEKIIPFFETYELRAKKRHDFILWKKAAYIVKKNLFNNRGYSDKEHGRLLEIRNEMKKYKSKRKEDYKNFPSLVKEG